MNTKLILSIAGLAAALAATSVKPAVTEASGEILVFKGSQESMGNVAFTIKPVLGRYLVYRGRPAGAAKPILTLQPADRLKDERIYRGKSTAARDLLYTVVQDAGSESGFLLAPAAGASLRQASFTLNHRGKQICAGPRCGDQTFLFTWAGGATSQRLWLYKGRVAAGRENVRFTIRGDLGKAMPLMPVLAVMR